MPEELLHRGVLDQHCARGQLREVPEPDGGRCGVVTGRDEGAVRVEGDEGDAEFEGGVGGWGGGGGGSDGLEGFGVGAGGEGGDGFLPDGAGGELDCGRVVEEDDGGELGGVSYQLPYHSSVDQEED